MIGTGTSTMDNSARPGKQRTAMVLALCALVFFLGYVVRIWMFGK